MVLKTTRSDRFMKPQLSRVDWGDSLRDLKSSLTASFGGNNNKRSDTGTSAGGGGGGGNGDRNSMADAAAAVASSYKEGVHGADAGGHLDGSWSDRYAPSSRYDPKNLKRIIVDINNDLAEGDSENNSDVEGNRGSGSSIVRKKQSKRGGGIGLQCRQALAIIAIVGIIVGAAFGIGQLVTNTKNNNNNTNDNGNGITLEHSNNNNGANFQITENQRLLEVAERVVSACSERGMNIYKGECRRLCSGNMCCVEKEEGSSSSSLCKQDESKMCAVYAGCQALLEGSIVAVNDGGAKTDVDRRIKWG